MPPGVFPEIIPLTSPQDEITRIANELAGSVKQGYPKKDLLLLHNNVVKLLAGPREIFDDEQSLQLSNDECEALIRENRRKLYMATTRTGQRLVSTYMGESLIALKTAFRQKITF